MTSFVPGYATSYTDGAAKALSNGSTTVSELVDYHLSSIAVHESRLSAFTRVMHDEARNQARLLDAIEPHNRGPLHGMILSIKDTIDVENVATTCGSRSRLKQIAHKDATLIARLRAAGAVFIGKANCHEFAFGGPAFDLPFPPARNPWDSKLFPGGSSSGSGVSVAAGFCHASIGTDTAGSIRLPSSHCGLVGLKPSRNKISLDGVSPLSPTLDSAGPMARSVADCAALYQVMTSESGPKRRPKRKLTLGVPEPEWLEKLDCHLDVIEAFEKACLTFSSASIALRPMHLPDLLDIHAASATVMMYEVADGYAQAVRDHYFEFGEMFRSRALLGENLSNKHYNLALNQCDQFAAEIATSLRGIDALLLPAYPVGPSPLVSVDKFYFLERPNLNAIANCTGMPTLSLPVLRDEARRPMGIQLMAARENESGLLVLGERLERLLSYPHELPFTEGRNNHQQQGNEDDQRQKQL